MKKKPIMLYVCRLLESQTDSTHFLTQTKIAELINHKYPCDRKTIGRDIAILKEMGFPIVKTPKGYYMERGVFSVDDLKFIEQSILNADGRTQEYKVKLANDTISVLTKTYKKRGEE